MLFQLERNLENELSHASPDWSIYAKFSTISLSVDVDQYKLIRGILDQNIGEKPPPLTTKSASDTSKLSPSSNFIINNPNMETVLSGQVWNVIRICFELENVGIDFILNNSSTSPPLAYMSFIKSCLIYESFSDGSKLTDLVSNEIRIRDAQSRELLSKKPRINPTDSQINQKSSNLQLEVHYRSNKTANRFSILFNNCRCLCVIGWLMRAKEFLTSYKNEDTNGIDLRAFEEIKLPNEVKLNLTSTDFLIVEDLSSSQSQAVMLRLTAFLEYNERRLERIVESCLQSVEVFACRVDEIEKTAVAIVDPMIVNILVKRKSMIGSESSVAMNMMNRVSNVVDEFVAEIGTDVLRMQVSYLDFYFFRRVFESIKQQMNGKNRFLTTFVILFLIF